MTSTDSERPGLAHLVAHSWPARVYLAVVVAAGIFVALSQTTHTAPDADLSGVWVIFATLPWSLPALLAIPDTGDSLGTVLFWAAVVVSALINATLIAWVTRRRS
ncbi:hypothetical protein KIH74_30455 [Kineosporia sp. J2-2]|uniref:SPW repeat-containing protein n=1 Tax=Kineosporia corallincola TaxID=2835133 RepID=A0ABS5TR63_9ACTN|nr:hypothetical protein [Kineosporia corallincola]MBT0773306.1 hypothetical protein [Kineosporia corallincola]